MFPKKSSPSKRMTVLRRHDHLTTANSSPLSSTPEKTERTTQGSPVNVWKKKELFSQKSKSDSSEQLQSNPKVKNNEQSVGITKSKTDNDNNNSFTEQQFDYIPWSTKNQFDSYSWINQMARVYINKNPTGRISLSYLKNYLTPDVIKEIESLGGFTLLFKFNPSVTLVDNEYLILTESIGNSKRVTDVLGKGNEPAGPSSALVQLAQASLKTLWGNVSKSTQNAKCKPNLFGSLLLSDVTGNGGLRKNASGGDFPPRFNDPAFVSPGISANRSYSETITLPDLPYFPSFIHESCLPLIVDISMDRESLMDGKQCAGLALDILADIAANPDCNERIVYRSPANPCDPAEVLQIHFTKSGYRPTFPKFEASSVTNCTLEINSKPDISCIVNIPQRDVLATPVQPPMDTSPVKMVTEQPFSPRKHFNVTNSRSAFSEQNTNFATNVALEINSEPDVSCVLKIPQSNILDTPIQPPIDAFSPHKASPITNSALLIDSEPDVICVMDIPKSFIIDTPVQPSGDTCPVKMLTEKPSSPSRYINSINSVFRSTFQSYKVPTVTKVVLKMNSEPDVSCVMDIPVQPQIDIFPEHKASSTNNIALEINSEPDVSSVLDIPLSDVPDTPVQQPTDTFPKQDTSSASNILKKCLEPGISCALDAPQDDVIDTPVPPTETILEHLSSVSGQLNSLSLTISIPNSSATGQEVLVEPGMEIANKTSSHASSVNSLLATAMDTNSNHNDTTNKTSSHASSVDRFQAVEEQNQVKIQPKVARNLNNLKATVKSQYGNFHSTKVNDFTPHFLKDLNFNGESPSQSCHMSTSHTLQKEKMRALYSNSPSPHRASGLNPSKLSALRRYPMHPTNLASVSKSPSPASGSQIDHKKIARKIQEVFPNYLWNRIMRDIGDLMKEKSEEVMASLSEEKIANLIIDKIYRESPDQVCS